MPRLLPAALPALALATACTPVQFVAQDVVLRHDSDGDVLVLELVHEGLHAGEAGLQGAESWVRRMAAGERVFILLGWPFVFDLDEGEEDPAAEDLPPEFAQLAERVLALEESVTVQAAGLFLDPDTGWLGAWQRIALADAQAGIATMNDVLSFTVLAALEGDAGIEVGDWKIEGHDRELLVRHARSGAPWFVLDEEALEVRLPLTRAHAAHLLKELVSRHNDPETAPDPGAAALLAPLGEVDFEGELLVLRFPLDADGALRWRFDAGESRVPEDLLGRLREEGVPLLGAPAATARELAASR